MAFWNRKKKDVEEVTERKSVTLGTSDSLGAFLMIGSGNGATAASALDLYRKSSAVSVPINRISTAIANMKFVVEREDGTIENSHPVLDLLRSPSPYFTKTLFMETISRNYLITGEMAVVAIGGIERPPIELMPISPDKLTVPPGLNGLPTMITIAGNTMAGSYAAIRKGNKVRYLRTQFMDAEIHLTRSFQTRNNSLLRGESLLVSASSEVRQHILGGQHNTSILEKGGRVSLIFHFGQDMTVDEFEEAKERVQSQYGGSTKAGTIGVTAGEGNLDIKDIGSKNKDMDFAVLQKMAKVAIANQYGYPLILLDTDAATFNNYGTAKEALFDDAALPFAEVILEGLSEMLMPRYGEDPAKLRIVPDLDSILALTTRRNNQLKVRKEIGIETVNELRDSIPNRDDVEGGDVVLVPANLIPINASADFLSNPAIDEGKDDLDKKE